MSQAISGGLVVFLGEGIHDSIFERLRIDNLWPFSSLLKGSKERSIMWLWEKDNLQVICDDALVRNHTWLYSQLPPRRVVYRYLSAITDSASHLRESRFYLIRP